MTTPLLHLRVVDSRFRRNPSDRLAIWRSIWVAPEHIAFVDNAPGNKTSDAAEAQYRAASARGVGGGGQNGAEHYEPLIGYAEVNFKGGGSYIVEGPPEVVAARLQRARMGFIDSTESHT